jgi:hypothetical protein
MFKGRTRLSLLPFPEDNRMSIESLILTYNLTIIVLRESRSKGKKNIITVNTLLVSPLINIFHF